VSIPFIDNIIRAAESQCISGVRFREGGEGWVGGRFRGGGFGLGEGLGGGGLVLVIVNE